MSGTVDVSQLNNLFSQITTMTGSLGNTQIGKSGMSYNDIAWLANAVGTVAMDGASSNQKASAVQNIIQKAMSIVETLVCNAEQAAKKEVKQETTKAQAILAKSENLGAQLDGDLTDIKTNIEAQSGIVEEASEALVEVQEAIAEKQEELAELAEQIQEKQQQLAETEDTNEKVAILAEIQGLSAQVAGIILEVQAQQQELNYLTAAVDDTTEDIEASTQKLAETEQEGLQELSEGYQESVSSATEVTATAATGAGNQATSVALQAAGEAAESNVITGATIAPQLFRSSADQQGAATERLTSIAQNISTLAQGIGGLQNSSQILASFKNSIGSALNGYADLVGSWDSQLEPVITSIGSLEGVQAAVTELQEDVKTDLGSLGFKFDKQGETKEMNFIDKRRYKREQSKASANNTNSGLTEVQDGNQEVGSQENTLLTPTFDSTKLRFGL